MPAEKQIDVDYLIIGSGISGLYLALMLADHGRVLVISKDTRTYTGTFYAQGGVASVYSEVDSIESHIQDTLNAGGGLNNPEAVRVLVSEGPEHIRRLLEMGVAFETEDGGKLHLAREGGHSINRVVHAGDHTGKEIIEVLDKEADKRGIEIREYFTAVELITRYHLTGGNPHEEAPRCYGAYVFDQKQKEVIIIRAGATVLATGGAGGVYLHNTNPGISTGDGVALAFRAGAVIANMEFYQFHPTALYSPTSRDTFLITEALRGYGALLRDINGKPFMEKYDERCELAPRDIVARAIDAEMKKRGSDHVWLDITHKSRDELMEHFPTVYQRCKEEGIDISKDMIPVVPAAHYMCGGVHTDLNGETCVRGLFAAGETAHTGVHGGNRLASNSLLEGLVFAARIARYLLNHKTVRELPGVVEWNKEGLANVEEWVLIQHNYNELKQIMHNYVGIVRSDLRLGRALRRVNLLYEELEDYYQRTYINSDLLELRNLTTVARLIVLSALYRKESRALHFNQDYPEDRSPSNDYTLIKRGPGPDGKENPLYLTMEELEKLKESYQIR